MTWLMLENHGAGLVRHPYAISLPSQVALLAVSLPVTWRAVALIDWWATTLLGPRPALG